MGMCEIIKIDSIEGPRSSVAEHSLGKGEVTGSTPVAGSSLRSLRELRLAGAIFFQEGQIR